MVEMLPLQGDWITAFASQFVHRWDAYAVQQRDGSYRCAAQPITYELLAGHLAGRWTLGTYVLNPENTCQFAVFDADQSDGFAHLLALADELASCGVSTLLEASRRGGHLWVHLLGPTPAALVRAWLLPFAAARGLELYPKQDALSAGGYGSLIRLPLGVHRRSRCWYPFVSRDASGQLAAVGETIEQCASWAAEHVWHTPVPVGVQVEQEQAYCSPIVEHVPNTAYEERLSSCIRQWCQGQDIFAIIGYYVHLDRRGVGCCPFKEHHARGDLRPSFQVFGGPDPHWHCYTSGQTGDVFTFLCRYFGLTPQEGWRRLCRGELVQ